MLEELQRKARLRKEREEQQVKLERQKTQEDAINKAAAENLAKRNAQMAEAKAEEQNKPYTAEDAKIVREVLNAKDYYVMMGVQRNFSDADLKKAYKKKALKLHPDRNNAPKAKDAFQKINAAMECLSDPEKKRVYDQVGNAEAFE